MRLGENLSFYNSTFKTLGSECGLDRGTSLAGNLLGQSLLIGVFKAQIFLFCPVWTVPGA